ncbi:glycosyltransferase family 4 protein [Marinobacter lipolyticus]|uniref:glycosyltransferase family 4 protein n=1 Tax=Marinobacter lipolyticus TaxID=209639 RepID=UPI003A95D035
MNIVHVVEAWKGGIASYVEVLVKDQVDRGYNVTILADAEQLASDNRKLDVPVLGYDASRRPWRFRSISSKLEELILKLGADVVHCHSTFPGLYVRLRNHSAKVIYTPHSWSFFKQDVNRLVRLAYRFAERVLSSRCESIVCMSMDEMASAMRARIPARKLHLVYSGIPKYQSEPVLNRDSLCECSLKVGFFGRFDYQKGFDLIEKLGPLLNETVELHLFGGAVRERERKLDSRLVDHGWIDHKSIPKHMASMDVILIPSRWEGFALTPLEAMRVGRPVIISNQSSLPEVVIHGFNGLVLSEFSTAELARLLNQLTRKECQRMGENASQVFAGAFKYSDFLDKMNEVYLSDSSVSLSS